MKIAIIGAGISGLIAEGAFSDQDNEIAIFDSKKEKVFSAHKAVMRLRSEKIKEYVGCRLKKITVYKAVYHDGKLYDKPNILLNNLYSLKTYDSLGERSLKDLGRSERYLISNVHRKGGSAIFKREFVGATNLRNLLAFSDGSSAEYDVCISTIPMPVLLKAISYKHEVDFSYSPIYITTAELLIESDVHQTIYFTDPDLTVPYRVTIEGKRLMAESIEKPGSNDLYVCLQAFGLGIGLVSGVKTHKQKLGKLNPIDPDKRRKIMMDLTSECNIYSFGRFATWRPLRIDQTLDDIEKIRMFVRVRHKTYYD